MRVLFFTAAALAANFASAIRYVNKYTIALIFVFGSDSTRASRLPPTSNSSPSSVFSMMPRLLLLRQLPLLLLPLLLPRLLELRRMSLLLLLLLRKSSPRPSPRPKMLALQSMELSRLSKTMPRGRLTAKHLLRLLPPPTSRSSKPTMTIRQRSKRLGRRSLRLRRRPRRRGLSRQRSTRLTRRPQL